MATDLEGDELTFAIIGGTGENVFRIDLTTGKVFVVDSEALNYEEIPLFTLFIGKNASPAEILPVRDDILPTPAQCVCLSALSMGTATGERELPWEDFAGTWGLPLRTVMMSAPAPGGWPIIRQGQGVLRGTPGGPTPTASWFWMPWWAPLLAHRYIILATAPALAAT